MLTGNKDTDRLILNKLDDKDLVNFCLSNKAANNFCNQDQTFWRDRVFSRFGLPYELANKYKGEKSWSEYYIDLQKPRYNVLEDGFDRNPSTILFYGAENDRLDLVMASLYRGADIYDGGDWPLRLASKNGNLDVVKYLVQNGSDIHSHYDEALRLASEKEHLDTVKYLVEQGADVHAFNDLARSWAFNNEQFEIVNYLDSLP